MFAARSRLTSLRLLTDNVTSPAIVRVPCKQGDHLKVPLTEGSSSDARLEGSWEVDSGMALGCSLRSGVVSCPNESMTAEPSPPNATRRRFTLGISTVLLIITALAFLLAPIDVDVGFPFYFCLTVASVVSSLVTLIVRRRWQHALELVLSLGLVLLLAAAI